MGNPNWRFLIIFFSLYFLAARPVVGEEDSKTLKVNYSIMSQDMGRDTSVDITRDTATNAITYYHSLKNLKCAQEFAHVIDDSMDKVRAPLLEKFAQQKDYSMGHTLLITFIFDSIGDMGPKNPNSNHCTLQVSAMEGGVGGAVAVFSYDNQKPGHFLPNIPSGYDDHGKSDSRSDFLTAAVLKGAFPQVAINVADNLKYKKEREAAKRRAAQKPKSPIVNDAKKAIDADEENLLKASRLQ